jgi:hypothetical protein
MANQPLAGRQTEIGVKSDLALRLRGLSRHFPFLSPELVETPSLVIMQCFPLFSLHDFTH